LTSLVILHIRCYNICFSIHCYLCLCFSICFLNPPSVSVGLDGRNTSLVAHIQYLTSKIKWLYTPSIVTTSIVMVIVSVVSIVEVVITSTFTAVSSFSTIMGVTTSTTTSFSTYLTLTCCYGICCYNIYCYNIRCYNICLAVRCYLCF